MRPYVLLLSFLLLAGCVSPSVRRSGTPFDVNFRREPGRCNYGMLFPTFPGYDPELPGYHVLGEVNGFVQMILRPTSAARPPSLVLALQSGHRVVNPATGGTAVQPCSRVRDRTEFWVFSVQQGDTRIENTFNDVYNPVITGGPTDYFRYAIVGDTVHVIFLPKAMALLDRECRVIWSHGLYR